MVPVRWAPGEGQMGRPGTQGAVKVTREHSIREVEWDAGVGTETPG